MSDLLDDDRGRQRRRHLREEGRPPLGVFRLVAGVRFEPGDDGLADGERELLIRGAPGAAPADVLVAEDPRRSVLYEDGRVEEGADVLRLEVRAEVARARVGARVGRVDDLELVELFEVDRAGSCVEDGAPLEQAGGGDVAELAEDPGRIREQAPVTDAGDLQRLTVDAKNVLQPVPALVRGDGAQPQESRNRRRAHSSSNLGSTAQRGQPLFQAPPLTL